MTLKYGRAGLTARAWIERGVPWTSGTRAIVARASQLARGLKAVRPIRETPDVQRRAGLTARAWIETESTSGPIAGDHGVARASQLARGLKRVAAGKSALFISSRGPHSSRVD